MDLTELVVNGRFTTQVMTGVQRYALEITRRIQKNIRIVGPRRPLAAALGHLWEQAILPRKVGENELLWSPGGSGPLSGVRQVVTIHDIAQIEHPEWYNPKFSKWYAWLTPRLIENSCHILTVSEFSRSRLIDYYGVDPAKVSAISLGVDKRFFGSGHIPAQQVIDKYGLPPKFLLTVGSLSPRKNFPRLIMAWNEIQRSYPNTFLVVVGHPSLRFAPSSEDLVFQNVIFTGYVDDVDLPYLYRSATAFVYPSLYEGFGLPVLEALAAGTPVITSGSSALSEIAADVALRVDPEDETDIAAALIRVLEDDHLHRVIAASGPAYARHFSWDTTANHTLDVLQRVQNHLPVERTLPPEYSTPDAGPSARISARLSPREKGGYTNESHASQ